MVASLTTQPGGKDRMALGRPDQLGRVNAYACIQELRGLFDSASDRVRESIPAPEDVLGLLRWSEQNVSSIPEDKRVRCYELRITLMRHIRREIDSRELVALKNASTDGVTLQQLAPMLGVKNKASVTNRRLRLEADAHRRPEQRRAPQTARQLRRERELAIERSETVRAAARALLAHQQDLLTNESIREDLAEIAHLTETAVTPAQTAALEAALRLLLRDISDLAATTGRPKTATVMAQRALDNAQQATTN